MRKKITFLLLFTVSLASAQVVTVTDSAGLFAALANAATVPTGKISYEGGTLRVDRPITVPNSLANKNKFSRLILDFNGATIEAAVAMPYVIGRALPDSQYVADNIMQSQGFTIMNAFIDCKSLATSGIVMRATYHDYIAHCIVVSAIGDGIAEKFGMNAYIFQCEVRNCGGYGISVTNGDWVGAATNNSGSNMASINNSRVFPKQNQTSAFASVLSGNTLLSGCIVDFAVNNKPQRGFFLNNAGSTTCKNVTVDRTWSESEISNCHYEIIGSGGTFELLRNYPQKSGTQVKVSGTNYTQVNVEKWGNVLGKFQAATNNGVVWRFADNAGSYDFSSSTNWVNAVRPINYYIARFGADQSYQYYIPSNRTLKINTKAILTAP